MSGRAWRFPALIAIPALIVAGILVQNSRTTSISTSSVVIGDMVPTASAPDSLSSTWYCAAGTSTGDSTGYAEQTVLVSNSSDENSTGVITVVPEQGASTTKPISIPAHGRTSVRTSDVMKSPWASALVEVSGGDVTVSHELRGAAGRSISSCSSSPSGTWYFPAGTTVAGSRNVIALFNPFPGEAAVDISFDTEDGARTPQQLQGMVVPGGRVVIVDVSQIVTLRERVSTTVSARTGRIVAEQVQSTEGRGGTDQGLTSVLGATSAAPVWSFPVATPASLEAHERITVFNPGDTDTDVQVEVQLDDPATNGSVEPFQISVPSHRAAIIDLGSDQRIPKAVGRWLLVRTVDGASIVAERWLGAPRTASTGGLALTMGVPVVATTWFGTLGTSAELSAAQAIIVNPSASATANVRLIVHSKGRASEVAALSKMTIAPGQRRRLDMADILVGRTDASIEIVSDVPVVMGQWLVSSSPLDFMTLASFPESGTESLPVDVISPSAGGEIDLTQIPTETVVLAPTSSTSSSTSPAPSTTTTIAPIAAALPN